jgi:serine/threonine-protein kinase HipA
MLGDRLVGAVLFEDGRSTFEYDPGFIGSGLELSPIRMPLSRRRFQFQVPGHFRTLPGLLADSLPDRFGNALVDAWLESKGIAGHDFDPVERLCYVGVRGMGALEYRPSRGPRGTKDHAIDVAAMVEIAGLVLDDRRAFSTDLHGPGEQAIKDILSIGTSAGGARAKAVIAYDEKRGLVRSGQVDPGPGFEHYLLKLDGVRRPGSESLSDGSGYGRIEYAYYLMARQAGIGISESRLLEEGGRAHFMTRRFDRVEGEKVHVQTLSALDHLDFNLPHSWEQAFRVARQIGLDMGDQEQMFLRAMFNVVFRNQDDHVKNISFRMDRSGEWSLAPAYDLVFAFNPEGAHTHSHQMSVAGESRAIEARHFRDLARTAGLRRSILPESLERVHLAKSGWAEAADEAGLTGGRAADMAAQFRDL